MALDESHFHRLADATLKGLMQAIDDLGSDAIDVDLASGILTLTLADGGTYVLNKQAPNRQIWLSSPRSGAWHFDHRGGVGAAAWAATRGGGTLAELLSSELGAVLGGRLDLG
jgi:frataxin